MLQKQFISLHLLSVYYSLAYMCGSAFVISAKVAQVRGVRSSRVYLLSLCAAVCRNFLTSMCFFIANQSEDPHARFVTIISSLNVLWVSVCAIGYIAIYCCTDENEW